MRWMPSPQSPGISPCGLHVGYGEPPIPGCPSVSLPMTRLPLITTWPIECPAREPVTRMPSPIAPVTVSPSTVTWSDLTVIPARHGALPGPENPFWSHIPLAVADPWTTAPFCPTSLSDVEMTTSSVYEPGQTTTEAPGGAASTAAWIPE